MSTGTDDNTGANDPGNNPGNGTNSTGIRAGEIIAYRAWQLVEDTQGGFWDPGLLKSTGVEVFWLPNKLMTAYYAQMFESMADIDDEALKEIAVRKPSTQSQNSTGVHCFKDRETLEREFRLFWEPLTVYGTIKIWGTVIEHETGYRAEYARLVSLDNIFNAGKKICSVIERPWLRSLRKKYGIVK